MNMIKEMLEKKEINDVKWVEGSQQLADSLTKKGVSSNKLLSVIIIRLMELIHHKTSNKQLPSIPPPIKQKSVQNQ